MSARPPFFFICRGGAATDYSPVHLDTMEGPQKEGDPKLMSVPLCSGLTELWGKKSKSGFEDALGTVGILLDARIG